MRQGLLLNLRDDGAIPPADLCRVPGENQYTRVRHGLAVAAIEDLEEVRQTCLDRLQTEKRRTW